MKKKLLCILLCAVMLISLVACGDDDTLPADSSSESSSSSSSVPGYTEPNDGYTAWDTEGYHIYVSTSGHDANDGRTKETAVETIARAHELALDYTKKATSESDDLIIAIEGGRYYIGETLSAVTGNEFVHVYYTSYGDAKAEFVGSNRVAADKIMLCTDEAILNRISNPDVRANLYEVDLSDYAELMLGLQARLKKLPGLGDSATERYDSSQFYSESGTLSPSRWPKLDDKIPNLSNKPITGYALSYYVNFTKNGEFKTPAQMNAEGGALETPMNIFVPDNIYDKLKSWDIENSEIFTVDFFSLSWDDLIHKVTGFVDYYGDNGKVLYPDPSRQEGSEHALPVKGYFTTDYGRNYNGEMVEPDAYGGYDCRYWYFINVLEEIQENGEFYFDDTNDKLYVYRTGDLVNEDIYVATLDEWMLHVNGENVTFKNLCFKQSQSGLIFINDSNNVTFDGCEIGQNSGSGFRIETSMNVYVKNSRVYETGLDNVDIKECSLPSNTSELVDANVVFDNCILETPGRVHYSYSMCFDIVGSNGITIKNCTMRDGHHGAIRWSWTSNLTVEYCDVYNFLGHLDDAGLFYNYQDIHLQIGIMFRHNAIHDIGAQWQHSLKIWYQDGYSSGYTIYHNLIYNFGASNDEIYNIGGNIFSKMKPGLVYDNLVFRIGNEIKVGAAAGGQADYVNEEALRFYLNVHSKTTQYTSTDPLWSIIESSGFDTVWEIASDDGRDYAFNMIKEMRTEKFHNEMMSTAVFVKRGSNIYDNGATFAVRDEVSYKDDNGKTQGLKQIELIYKAVGRKNADRPKGYIASYENGDFSSFEELYQLLFDDFGCTLSSEGSFSGAFTLKYRGFEIGKFYPGVFTLDTPDNPDTDEYDAVYKISKAVMLKDSSITSIDSSKLFGINNHGTWGYRHVYAMMHTDAFKLCKYDNNLTVGLPYSFSSSKETWRMESWEVTNSYDGAPVDFLIVDESGNYTQDFLIYYENLITNNRIDGFELLDLSKIGSNLA